MRSFTSLTTALLVSLAATLSAQVSTVPVGFNTAAVPAATSATTPSNTVISAPFYQVATFQGALTSLDSSNQVSFSGAAFGDLTTTPFLARFKTGNSVGRFFRISANTPTQLTLDTNAATGGSGYTLTTSAPSSTQTQLAVGDSVEICPANSLNTLFPSGAPFGTGTSATGADNVLLFNGTAWETYFFNTSVNQWRRSGSGLNQNNKIVFPDQGMFIVRRTTSAVNVTFLGTVPSTTEKTDFPGAGSSFKANRFPIDLTFGTGNLSNNTELNLNLKLAGWHGGTSANDAGDNIYLWNGTSWSVYFYNTSVNQWRRSGSGLNQNTTVIPLGAAIFVVRTTSASGSNSTLTQALPYTL
ncbi:MAG TPA: TIGR02597 family protein [Chthoniobacterales bacterium]|jgi:uncharacterized protein (TIGR02597 family)